MPEAFDAAERAALERMAWDFGGALEAAGSLARERPRRAARWQLLAYLRNYRRDWTGALEALARLRALEPNDASHRFNSGYCLLQAGRLEEGERELALAERMSAGRMLEATLVRALALEWLGEASRAAALRASAAQRAPADPAALFYAARGEALAQLVESPGMPEKLVAFVNRYDAPLWDRLDDKESLARLMRERSPRPGCWPESHVLPEDAASLRGKPGWWIVKPGRLFGGQGATLISDTNALEGLAGVAQRYIEQPLLAGGHKAHLRLYLFVQPEAPARVSLMRDAIVRCALKPYALDRGAPDDERHITNTMRFVAAAAARGERQPPTARVMGLQQYIAEVPREIAAAAPERLALLAGEVAALVRARLAAEAVPGVPPKLLGLDVILDASGKPWLLEIERYPALSVGTAASINAALFADLGRALAGAGLPAGRWQVC